MSILNLDSVLLADGSQISLGRLLQNQQDNLGTLRSLFDGIVGEHAIEQHVIQGDTLPVELWSENMSTITGWCFPFFHHNSRANRIDFKLRVQQNTTVYVAFFSPEKAVHGTTLNEADFLFKVPIECTTDVIDYTIDGINFDFAEQIPDYEWFYVCFFTTNGVRFNETIRGGNTYKSRDRVDYGVDYSSMTTDQWPNNKRLLYMVNNTGIVVATGSAVNSRHAMFDFFQIDHFVRFVSEKDFNVADPADPAYIKNRPIDKLGQIIDYPDNNDIYAVQGRNPVSIGSQLNLLDAIGDIITPVFRDPVIVGDPAPLFRFPNTSTFNGWAFPYFHRDQTNIVAIKFGPVFASQAGPLYISFLSEDQLRANQPHPNEFVVEVTPDQEYYTFEFPTPINPVEISGENDYFYFAYRTKGARFSQRTYSSGAIGSDRADQTNPSPVMVTYFTETNPSSNNGARAAANAERFEAYFYDKKEWEINTGTEEPDAKEIQFHIPKTIYGVVNEDIEIYKSGIIDVPATANSLLVKRSSTGKYRNEIGTFHFSSAGTFQIDFDVYDDLGTLNATLTTQAKVSAPPTNPSTQKNVLVIGDSLTNANTYVQELQRRLCQTGGTPVGNGLTNLRFIGTRGTTPANHEGRGGWASGSYLAYSDGLSLGPNPFWNTATSRNDFVNYMSVNGFTGAIDVCVIFLGWNETTTTVTLANFKTLIGQIRADYPNCKFVIVGLQSPSIEGMADNYSTNTAHWNPININRIINKKNQEYEDMCLDPLYSGFCFYAPVKPHFQHETGYPTASVATSKRDATLVTLQNNGVHPNQLGYYQIADAIYACIVNTALKLI